MQKDKVGAFHLLYEQFLVGEDIRVAVDGPTFSAACQELGGAFRSLEEDYQRRMALRSIEEGMDELDKREHEVWAELMDAAEESIEPDDSRYEN